MAKWWWKHIEGRPKRPIIDALFADTNGPLDQTISKTGRAISARVARREDDIDALRFG